MVAVSTVFLSHRRGEKDDADALTKQLQGRWEVVTHAVDPAAAATWQADCRRLIAAADAVVCIVGPDTALSPNVDWELETALLLGRPVIAARAAAAPAPRLPAPLAARGARLHEPRELPERLDEVALEHAG